MFASSKLLTMVVISKAILKEFAEKNPDADKGKSIPAYSLNYF
jgi:hypothetical protein